MHSAGLRIQLQGQLRRLRCAFQIAHSAFKSEFKRTLTPQATKQVVHALVTSRLDLYNGTLHGFPDLQIRRLQKVQNSAARLITGSKSSDHITPVLKQLHWLQVRQRLDYKTTIFDIQNQVKSGS